jgi:hypothetical protein
VQESIHDVNPAQVVGKSLGKSMVLIHVSYAQDIDIDFERDYYFFMNQVLKTEFETYLNQKPELLKSAEHQFVLIKATSVVGTFPDFRSALQKGYEKFGFVPFFIRKIEAVEAPAYIRSSYAS